MKKPSFVTIIAILIVMLFCMVHDATAEAYKIGPGDLIEISVWKNPDLSRQLVVLPDGSVHFPLIGQLSVQDKSVPDLEQEVIKKLIKYIPEPVVSVTVFQPDSMMIYVIGKVNQPGRFEINNNINALQALAVAGGLNPFAREKEIKIFRKNENKTFIYNFNYKEVSQGKKLSQNIMLRRGDVIVVQ